MINDGELSKNYILVNDSNKKLVKIKVNNTKHFFLVDKSYFITSFKNDFTLKEKLYILNLPINVTWYPIPKLSMYILSLFFMPITPKDLKLDISPGKINIYISKSNNLKGA